MKPKYIKINDVSDIDTAKASVYDLNNRYIDKNGVMYGLKYNPGLRRIDIIRIVRAADKEVTDMQQKILKKKFSDVDSHLQHADLPQDSASGQESAVKQDFNPDQFIAECLKQIQTHRQRLKGIIMNIKNSNIFTKDNKQESIALENIFRNIEIDGERAFDHVDNYQKEIQGYPRSINYYQAKMDRKGNAIVEGLAGDRDRAMKFVYLYEMHASITHLYKTLISMVSELQSFMDEKNVDDMKNIPHLEKQAFLDAKTSTRNTIREIEAFLDSTKQLEEYLNEPDNF